MENLEKVEEWWVAAASVQSGGVRSRANNSPCPVGADVTVIESEKELSLGSSSSCGMEGRRRPGMRRVK